MKRSVKIRNTQSNETQTFTTEATTFGELKTELGNSFDGQKVIVREGRQTLELNDAKLPEGSFHLFVTPVDTKSGLTEADVEKMTQHELRAEAKERGLPANAVTNAYMRRAIVDYDAEQAGENGPVEAANEEVVTAIDAVISALEEVKEQVRSMDSASAEQYGATAEDLQREVDGILAELG